VEAGQPGEEWVELGHVLGAHGVRGDLRIHSSTRPTEAIGRYRRWLLDDNGSARSVTVRGVRRQGKGLVARIEEVTDRDEAEALAGATIRISAADLPPPAPGEYYWRDLIGCEVVNLDGEPLGDVAGLFETGANDVMVVQGERERLIPFTVGHAVRRVDLDAGRIEVDWDPAF